MKLDKRIKLGVIADDFTGASDAASFLVKNGYKTILRTSIDEDISVECECIVVALKSRSVVCSNAIEQTKQAVDFLKTKGVTQFYFKYCSTFDSTPKGNIGPVLDFLLEYLHVPYTIICPSLPINGRCVRDGVLYVDGKKLSESSMKNHPLNPMWSSYIPTLMKEQSKHPCYILSRDEMKVEHVNEIIEMWTNRNQKFYFIPDYENDQDGKKIAELFETLPVLSGGSGLLQHVLPYKKTIQEEGKHSKSHDYKTIILCGSCSQMTKKQINKYRENGGITYAIDSKQLLRGELKLEDVFEQIIANGVRLIYSDAIEKDMKHITKSKTFQEESRLVEQFLSKLSLNAISNGFNRIVVAGGETSGAVTMRLGYGAYHIEPGIAPGVPTLIPFVNPNLTLILKSGNFGSEDFFEKIMERI